MVDFLEFPNFPVFNVADSAIVCGGAAGRADLRGIAIDGRCAGLTSVDERADRRTLSVPEGLEERLDAALARMFGLSRSRAAQLVAAGT